MTTDALVTRLHQEVIVPLKHRFVGRDEVIDLIALALAAREHLFLHGPPGTAKSALIRHFARAVQGNYFEYMLTRFSEPNEIFGPIDIAKLREGTMITVTKGMLPEAEFVFLDELFNANSAILNNLLTVLNERVYRRGIQTHVLPLLSLFSASNHLPEDETLTALFDRFLLRCHVGQLNRDVLPDLLHAGWALEGDTFPPSSLTAQDLATLSLAVLRVDLAPAEEAYREAIFKIRDLGIAFSRSPGGEGDEIAGCVGGFVRPGRCPEFRSLGAALCMGPRGTNRPLALARQSHARRTSKGFAASPVVPGRESS